MVQTQLDAAQILHTGRKDEAHSINEFIKVIIECIIKIEAQKTRKKKFLKLGDSHDIT